MDFGEQAKAIWAALDDMAEKSPEQYKQFINDQLNGDGAEEMMKSLGLGPKDTTRKNSTGKSKATEAPASQPSTSGSSGYKAHIPTKKRSFLTTSNGPMQSKVEGKDNFSDKTRSHASNNSLLDDAFSTANSSLIVNPLMAHIMADDQEEEEIMSELQLPEEGSGDTGSKPKSSKPLIEEL